MTIMTTQEVGEVPTRVMGGCARLIARRVNDEMKRWQVNGQRQTSLNHSAWGQFPQIASPLPDLEVAERIQRSR